MLNSIYQTYLESGLNGVPRNIFWTSYLFNSMKTESQHCGLGSAGSFLIPPLTTWVNLGKLLNLAMLDSSSVK